MRDTFDYVIIGGGSAGCACAGRLSEIIDGTICLLEAGPTERDIRVKVPFGLVNLLQSDRRNWKRRTTPQKHAENREIAVPRGRMIGGSGAINSMVWFRGRAADFDTWAVPGWGWSEGTRSAFEAVESRIAPRRLPDPHPLSEAFGSVLAANDRQEPPSPEGESAGVFHTNMVNGARNSAADAFLRPAQAKGRITVQTDAEVDRIAVSDHRATGVVLRNGQRIMARRGVVLSGGAIESPMVLFRSGIGPGSLLQTAGIDVVRDVPQVGANLHDHPGFGVHFAGPGSGYGLTLGQLPAWAWSPFQWALFRKGRLSSNTVEAGAFYRVMPGEGPPDVQTHFLPFMLGWQGRAVVWGAGYFADVCVMNPRSRGALTLGRDPYSPMIDLNLLSDPYDLEVMLRGVKRLRVLLGEAPLDPHRAEEVFPGSAVEGAALETAIRNACGTAYHPVGTIALASVLAPDLSFPEIGRLWVADASVMPSVTSANTNAPSMMIGWRAAEFIAKAETRSL